MNTNIELITNILKINQTGENTELVLDDGTSVRGVISGFDGITVTCKGNECIEIPLDKVVSVAVISGIQWSGYIGKRINVLYIDENIESDDGVLFSEDNENISIITAGGLKTVNKAGVKEVTDIASNNSDEESKRTAEKKQSNKTTVEKNNAFEESLITADKNRCESYVNNENQLSKLGYSDEEIERIKKGYKNTNWKKDSYSIALRLYLLQLNKDELAEKYYLIALEEHRQKKDETYNKIINTIANIKKEKEPKDYISFFKAYRGRLEKNKAYCVEYILKLIEARDTVELQKERTRMKALFEENEYISKRYQEFIEYFNLDEVKRYRLELIPVIKHRTEIDVDDYDKREKELQNISALPDKNAVKSLLNIYREELLFDEFFALFDYFYFFLNKEKGAVSQVNYMLQKIENVELVNKYLPLFPVLWCEKNLLAKINEEIARTQSLGEKFELLNRHKSEIIQYSDLNALESAIVNKNMDSLKMLLSNPNELESMGYDEAEIEEMLSIDLAEYEGEILQSYTMRRVLAFQRNKNNTAERYLFEAYYTNKVDMCNRLFPLLIEDNRGDLMVALFEYDESLLREIPSGKQLYYKALNLSEKNDDIFYAKIRDGIYNCKDTQVLERTMRIAEAKGDSLFASKIKHLITKIPVNEFEKAIIDADSDALRIFVDNADLLVEFGYTPEEIEKIRKIFYSGNFSKSGTKGDVGKRVFYFQKNKNGLAERLLFDALVESEYSVEDNETISVCRELYNIYVAQKNDENVCLLFEKYLEKALSQKFNPTYAFSYVASLYRLERYRDIYNFWEKYEKVWETFNSPMLIVFVMEKIEKFDKDSTVWKKITFNASYQDCIEKYIKLLIAKDKYDVLNDRISVILDGAFMTLSDANMSSLIDTLKTVDISRLHLNNTTLTGLRALLGQLDEDQSIMQWIDEKTKTLSYREKTDFVIKAFSVFENKKEILLYEMDVCASFKSGQDDESGYKKLCNHIMMNLSEDEIAYKWSETIVEKNLEVIDSTMLFDIWKFVKKQNNTIGFFKTIKSVISRDESFEESVDEYLRIIIEYYEINKLELSESVSKKICRYACSFSQKIVLSDSSCLYLLYLCHTTKMKFAKAYGAILRYRNAYSNVSSIATELAFDISMYKNVGYIDAIEALIANDDTKAPCAKLEIWAKYFDELETDESTFKEIHTKNVSANLWSSEVDDALGRAIFAKPSEIEYWKMLRDRIKVQSLNPLFLVTVLYQLVLFEHKNIGKVADNAIRFNMKNIAVWCIKQIICEGDESTVSITSHSISNAQKMLRDVVKRGWLNTSIYGDIAQSLIEGIKKEMSFSKDENFEWGSVCAALDVALATDKMDLFLQEFNSYLRNNCIKQLCVVICYGLLKEKKDIIEKYTPVIQKYSGIMPHKDLIIDTVNNYNSRPLKDEEIEALNCIICDYGNAFGVDDIFEFYRRMCIEGKRELGINTIHLLQKYYPMDSVLYEVEALFMEAEERVNNAKIYYSLVQKYLNIMQLESVLSFYVGQMACCEYYLTSKGHKVDSFKRFLEIRYEKGIDKYNSYVNCCNSLSKELANTPFEAFTDILVSAIFSGEWRDVFEYGLGEKIIDEALNNLNSQGINIVDDEYKAVIKSIVLYVLKNRDAIDSLVLDRMSILWGMIQNKGLELIQFVDIIKSTNREYESELINIWDFEVSNSSIFRKQFGLFILMHENCDKYADIFSVFINTRSMDLFKKADIDDVLCLKDRQKALDIARAYDALYVNPEGYYESYFSNIKHLVEADYEDNSFAQYLAAHTLGYFSPENLAEHYRDKYATLSKLYGNLKTFRTYDINLMRKIATVKSLVFFFFTITGKQDSDIEVLKKNKNDYINAVTIALSSDVYARYIDLFLSKYDAVEQYVAAVQIELEKKNFESAIKYVLNMEDVLWKNALAGSIKARYKHDIEDSLMKELEPYVGGYSNYYWAKNYSKCKKLKSLETSKYFVVENDDYEENYINEEIEEQQDNVLVDDTLKEDVMNTELEDVALSDNVVDYSDNDEPDYNDIYESDTQDDDIIEINYINRFLELEYEEKATQNLQKRIIKLMNEVQNNQHKKGDFINTALEIGRVLMDNSKDFNYDLFIEMLKIVDANCLNRGNVESINNLFGRYLLTFTNIDDLCESYSYNKNAIDKIKLKQSAAGVRGENTKSVSLIISILENMYYDLEADISDDSIRVKISEYRRKLGKNRNINYKAYINHLIGLLQEKEVGLNKAPKLEIMHSSNQMINEDNEIEWQETWFKGVNKSHIKGYVINKGYAPAHNVKLQIAINQGKVKNFAIDTLYETEKLAFSVEVCSEDITDGCIKWTASVEYGENKEYQSGRMRVISARDDWNPMAVGLGSFNTKNPAEGENFVGRKNEINILFSYYNSLKPVEEFPSLLVTGLRRVGKTSVIKQYANLLEKEGRVVPIYVDAQKTKGNPTIPFISEVNRFLYKRKTELGEDRVVAFKEKWEAVAKSDQWVTELPYFYMDLKELYGDKKIIIIMDEVECVFYSGCLGAPQEEEQFFGLLRSLIQNDSDTVSFIFCGSDKLLISCLEQKRESQLFQVLQRIHVGRMSVNDIYDMFTKYNETHELKFSKDVIDNIIYYTGGSVYYTRLVAEGILEKIINAQQVMPDEINNADVTEAVEMLINGDLGPETMNLLDNNFGAKRKAILHSMADITDMHNRSVSMDEIMHQLENTVYIDNLTGESISKLAQSEIDYNLKILEKMDFITKDKDREGFYYFSTELYRVWELSKRKVRKFILKESL